MILPYCEPLVSFRLNVLDSRLFTYSVSVHFGCHVIIEVPA